MPAVVVAVAAAAAASYAGAAGTAALVAAGYLTAGSAAAAFSTALIGAVVATAVSYAGSSILGVGQQKATAGEEPSREREQLIQNAIEPQRIIYGRARVSGPIVYSASTGEKNEFLHLVIPLAGHRTSQINAVWINDIPVYATEMDGNGDVINPDNQFGPLTTGDGGNYARIRRYNGQQTTADSELVAATAPDGWSEEHVGTGITYIYVRLRYDQGVFPSGLQNVYAEVFGADDVYDPRTGDAGYSNNPALCILHYLRADFGLRCADDEIDWDSFSAAANICDEDVPLNSDGSVSQKRYTLDGSFQLDATPSSIVDGMLSSCGGTITYVQGKFRLYVAAYEAPTDTLDVSEIAGDTEVETRPPGRELFNTVKGTYVDPERDWQDSEFPAWSEPLYVAEDGETLEEEITLPFTIDGTRAQRLAKIALRRARESLTVRVPVRFAGFRYAVWQTIAFTDPDFGWEAKPFRISEWEFDPQSGLVYLTMREEGAQSYAWLYDEASTLPPAPNTSLINPLLIPAPTGLDASEELFVTRDGLAARTRVVLRWLDPAHPFINGYDVELRPSGGAWRAALAQSGEQVARIDDVAPGVYEWRVRARSAVAVGAWASVTQSVGALAAAPPAALGNLQLQTIGGLAFLSWSRSPDIDVVYGGRIEVRHTPETSAVTWVNATSIGEAVPGNATFTMLPLKPGTYFLKAVDVSGVYGDASSITTEQATAQPYANVDEVVESVAFSGAKTGTIVIDDTLRLNAGGDIDDAPDFDAITDVDNYGGVLTEGSYAFSGGIDLGAVKPIRLTSRLGAAVVNTFDDFDSRVTDIDTWPSFDGLVGGEADAWVEVRQTDDNPSASPSWGDWRRLDASEFRARAFEFRAQLRSLDTAFNIHVSELAVYAEEATSPAEVLMTSFSPVGVVASRTLTPTGATTLSSDTAGGYVEVGETGPRFSSTGRLLVAPLSSTNGVRNPRGEGASAPSTLPTNWSVVLAAGLTTTVVSTQVNQGVPTITLNVAGTASSTIWRLAFDTTTAIVAASGQPWMGSLFARLVAAPNPPNSYSVRLSGRSGGGGTEHEVINEVFVPTATLARYSSDGTLANASTARIQQALSVVLTNGATVDFTIEVGLPDLKQSSFLTSPILPVVGTPAASTRSADVPVWTPLPFPLNYTLVFDFDLLAVSAASTQGALQIDDGTDNNRIVVRNPSGGSALEALVISGGSTLATLTMPGTVLANTVMRCALRVAPGQVAMSFGGGAVQSATVVTPTLTRFAQGHGNAAGTLPGAGSYGDLRLFRALLSDASLRSLSI